MKWYKEIFLDWANEYSWLRVAASPVVVACVFGIVWSVVTHWEPGVLGSSALLGVIFACKWLQTKEEARSEKGNG